MGTSPPPPTPLAQGARVTGIVATPGVAIVLNVSVGAILSACEGVHVAIRSRKG